MDVRDGEQVEGLVAAVTKRYGRPDLVVNNAGWAPTVDAATASSRLSRSIVALNLLAPVFVSQAANWSCRPRTTGAPSSTSTR